MSFEASKKFYDDANFPRGFHRSGDFTKAQANTLEMLGNTLKALHEGKLDPTDEIEAHFVSVCRGDAKAETDVEKAWTVYLNTLKRKKIYFTASAAATESTSEGTDSDDD
ncbi:MAG: DUF413 domain-containing protein [Oceanobacter sp.]